ncbi:rhodanese family protein [Pseudorhodoferax sp.]|uniref:rhodanese family protein n=1 Tax=Pseudorhodoferax sp. TaxID=1993553 RepID=UPI0039E21AC9
MSVATISPQDARDLVARGAVLVDIRSADEHARERIGQAVSVPLERLSAGAVPAGGAAAVVFHCRSGQRTRLAAQVLGASVACDAYLLDGGLDAWKRAGLPVVVDARQPLALQRQVQLAAGALIVLGCVLGATVSPWFHALSGAVGAGLVFAGASGFCGMARVLMKMPWNRRALAG